MTRPEITILVGEVLDERLELDFEAFCRSCRASREFVVGLVDEGVLEPRGNAPDEWRFGGQALRRAQIAARLQRELDVNLAGAALVIDLLEELERLRRELALR